MKRIFLSFFCFLLITLAVLDFIFVPLVDMVVEHYLKHQINAYSRSLVSGLFYTIETDLHRYPQKQWPDRIETAKPHFGFPINIAQHREIDLDVEENRQLKKGMILVKDDGDMFYRQIQHSDWVVVLGPVEDLRAEFVWLNVFVWAALLAVGGILTIIWALPFGRKLHHISAAAQAFGNGRLDTRAKVPRRSTLAPLADAFNHMADRIQQLISAQKELTNAVSHELRTPISRIRFSLEMLEDASNIAERKHYLDEVLKDVDELDELVTESLTYANFDQGAPQIEWQKHAIAPWLQQIAKNTLKGHMSIDFRCRNFLNPPDREVLFEPRYMGRAIGNLIQNAARYGKKRIEVSLTEEEGNCIIHVDDDGPGIPEADRRRVFKAFTRLDSSRSRSSGGFGLGLAIVQRVVTWHGGRIWVSDAPLGGARFTICWAGFSTTTAKTLK